MQDLDDLALLRDYATNNSESSFEELVSRRVNFVYSAALRQTRNPNLAEEITQAVFIILAKKAGRISDKTNLIGWLFKTTRFAELAQIRAESKRARQQKEFQMQSQIDDLSRRSEAKADEIWNQMSPLLDEALATLGEKDRQALLLRFFENKSLAEVGNVLGAGEDTARKRVSRALEKLRKYFSKRGVSSTTAIIAGTISANSVQAAPVTLAKSVTAVAIAKGAAAGGSTLTLIKGALKIMAWTKMKMTVVIGIGILLATGTTVLTIKEIQNYRNDNYPWQVENPTPDMLEKIPPLVKIVPTKFPNKNTSEEVTSGPSAMGIGVRIQDILWAAYDPERYVNGHKKLRMLLLAKISSAKYDYIVNFKFDSLEAMQQELSKQSSDNVEALQQELKKRFGLVGKRETIVTNVLLLKVKYPGSSGLEPITAKNQVSPNQKAGEISFQDQQGLQTLAGALANDFRMPVFDETGLTNQYYYDLKWNPSGGQQQNQLNLKQALVDQLGLELVPSREPIEMLVVEKVK